MILGLAGRKRVGKNTAADYLTAQYGFVQVSFAEPIRNLLEVMNPIVPSAGGHERLLDVLERHGSFDAIKEEDPRASAEIRKLMQRAGTEWGRATMDGCVWIMALEDYLNRHIKGWWNERGPRVAVTDVRFDNEARWVRLNRGRVINIERPAIVSIDGHASEAGIDGNLADYHVFNLGTKEELYGQLRDIYSMETNNVALA